MSDVKIEQTDLGPKSSMTGPVALSALLEQLAARIENLGGETSRWLNPGIGRENIETQLASVGLQANEELLVWFGWRNGLATSATGEIKLRILPGIIPGSLEQLVKTYRTNVLEFVVPDYQGVQSDPRFFSYGTGFGWLPLETELNSRYAVYCRGELQSVPLVRRAEQEYFSWDDRLKAVSLCTVVTWWLEGIESGAHRWNTVKGQWDAPIYSLLPESQRSAGFR